MNKMSKLIKHVAAVLVAVTLSAGVPPPQAFANIIATDAVVAATARDRIAQALSRSEVSARLVAYGVDPADVRARVGALTDQEAVQLADRIDALPAGGNAFIGALVFVFLVLLITDILGLTKIFPFTRPVR
jgi:hypothetical protein